MNDRQDTTDKLWAEVKDMYRKGDVNLKSVIAYIMDMQQIEPIRDQQGELG